MKKIFFVLIFILLSGAADAGITVKVKTGNNGPYNAHAVWTIDGYPEPFECRFEDDIIYTIEPDSVVEFRCTPWVEISTPFSGHITLEPTAPTDKCNEPINFKYDACVGEITGTVEVIEPSTFGDPELTVYVTFQNTGSETCEYRVYLFNDSGFKQQIDKEPDAYWVDLGAGASRTETVSTRLDWRWSALNLRGEYTIELREEDSGIMDYVTKSFVGGDWCGKDPVDVEEKTSLQKFMYINQDDLLLCLYTSGKKVGEFPISTGRDGSRTPGLSGWIAETIPESDHDFGYDFGSGHHYANYVTRLYAHYYIHGPVYIRDPDTGDKVFVPDPATYLGVCRDSDGCVRMREEDAKAVWDWRPTGEYYKISYPPSSPSCH